MLIKLSISKFCRFFWYMYSMSKWVLMDNAGEIYQWYVSRWYILVSVCSMYTFSRTLYYITIIPEVTLSIYRLLDIMSAMLITCYFKIIHASGILCAGIMFSCRIDMVRFHSLVSIRGAPWTWECLLKWVEWLILSKFQYISSTINHSNGTDLNIIGYIRHLQSITNKIARMLIS